MGTLSAPAIFAWRELADSSFVAVGLGGSFAIFLIAGPAALELVLAELGAAVLAFAHHAAFGGLPEQSACYGLGAAAMLAIAVRAARTSGARRSEALGLLRAALLLPAFLAAAPIFLRLTILFHPRVRDVAMLALDEAFGQPSFMVARVLQRAGPLGFIADLAYDWLPVAWASLWALQRRRGTAGAGVDMAASFLVASVVGFGLYHLNPVIGPLFFVGDRFPETAMGVVDLAAVPPVPRNCFPSLHTTWAILLYWHARPLGLVARVLAGAWLVLMAVATLGRGWHYLVDLIVAVPFAAAVYAVAGPKRIAAGRTLAATATGLVAVWYAVAFGWPPSWPSAAVVVLGVMTVVAAWALQARWGQPVKSGSGGDCPPAPSGARQRQRQPGPPAPGSSSQMPSGWSGRR